MQKLADIQFSLNTRIDSSRKQSPFMTMLGYLPRNGPSALPHPQPQYMPPHLRHWQASYHLAEAKERQATQANKHRSIPPKLQEGDEVYIHQNWLPRAMKASKLDPLYSGPFKVTHINHWTDNYSCDFTEFPELQAIHNKFHISALKPAEKAKTFTKQNQKPGPVENDRWEVEKVLEFRTHPRTGAKQYKVR